MAQAEDMAPLVTLTTDFGTADGYVGTMKGVILGIAPNAQLVDISHHIAPQDVRQAAYVLYTAYPFFPPHTVHLVVVDPGVGSARRPIALRTPCGTFVGPDNGVFSYLMASEHVDALVQLSQLAFRLPQVSYTFHGRDVFAPAAAHLAAGTPIMALGPTVADPVRFTPPRLELGSDAITGEILHLDHFGNAVTSIGRLTWAKGQLALEPAFEPADSKREMRFEAEGATVIVGETELRSVHRTYADVQAGDILALVGSEGYLEIAVREGSAAQRLRLQPGDKVVLRL